MGECKHDREMQPGLDADDGFGHLAAMEPALHRLRGLILATRLLGETEDAVEPEAIGALASCAAEIIERLHARWTLAFEAWASVPKPSKERS